MSTFSQDTDWYEMYAYGNMKQEAKPVEPVEDRIGLRKEEIDQQKYKEFMRGL